MSNRFIGLTKPYNLFHSPDIYNKDIVQLRALHDKLDRCVLTAYGWNDLSFDCVFELDIVEMESESDKKKYWRYRWNIYDTGVVIERLLQFGCN
jgi:hypothetical protein